MSFLRQNKLNRLAGVGFVFGSANRREPKTKVAHYQAERSLGSGGELCYSQCPTRAVFFSVPECMLSGRSAAWLARLVRDQEAGGSNPLAPTTLFRINDFHCRKVTRTSGELLVRNQAFLHHVRWTRRLFVR